MPLDWHSSTDTEAFKSDFALKSDIELTLIADAWAGRTPGSVAKTLLLERQEKLAEAKHAELLTAIEKTHWSVTPAFWVGLVTMVAACVAAYPVLFSQPQAQQSVVVTAPPAQTIQPVSNTPSSSQLQLPHSPAAQINTTKR